MNCHDAAPIVHQLPEYEAEGHPPSIEYPLPVDVHSPEFAAVNPWLLELAHLTPGSARADLAARWSGLRNDSLQQIRDYLLECDATSLVLTGSRGWLLCVHPQQQAMNLVAPPIDAGFIQQRLSEWRIDGHSVLAELLVNFGGLREDFAPGGGCFIDERKWEGVTESWMRQINGHAEWEGALIVFSSRGGDKLLVDRDGRVGWWMAGEMRMREAYPDLPACLVDFVRYRTIPWPYDPYPPPVRFPRVFGGCSG